MAALAPVSVEIEHIDLTAVHSLVANPIIGIVVVVNDITAAEDQLDSLLAAGHVLWVRELSHRLVRTPSPDVHVRICERDCPESS